MKRHPGLVSLSHDHHQALFVALGLRRAREDSAQEAAAAFLEFWRGHGQAHFRAEEEVLFPAYARHGSAHDPGVARALGDHVSIRRLAQGVEAGDRTVPTLTRIGDELERHVRFEERTLFPMIEHAVPDGELLELARRLAEREAAGG